MTEKKFFKANVSGQLMPELFTASSYEEAEEKMSYRDDDFSIWEISEEEFNDLMESKSDHRNFY